MSVRAVGRKPFTPPHCPNPDCDSHADPGPWRFVRKGFYVRAAAPQRVQRYRCSHCGRCFSSQTFSTTYWLRRPDLLRPVFHRILACSALRQIAHEYKVSHSTIQRGVERLGRHCLLVHEALRPKGPLREPVVLDGFRSFENGQYWPFDLNLLVGRSHFIYGFNDAELRRSGTHTPAQLRKRAWLEKRFGRPRPQATRDAVRELVARIVPAGSRVELWSDEHPSYPTAFRRLRNRQIDHETVSSRRSRTARNPLHPVNLADLLLRHTGANHKRETIAFSKRRQGALYRAAIFAVWRNYVKCSSERHRTPPPGVMVGAIPERMRVEELLAERRFPWRENEITGWLERCYFGRIPTRSIPKGRQHVPRYAV
jgi:transposase-like protein